MDEEEWKTIKDTDDLYEISNKGRVRSWNQRGNNRPTKRDEPLYLKRIIDNAGYYACSVVQGGKWVRKRIHRLLGLYFIPNPDNLPYVLHKNDIKTDIRLSNLYWGTQKQNIKDSFRNGNSPKGEECANSKLSRNDVKEIKKLLNTTDLYHREIAEMFGVSRQVISDINNDRCWSHVECGSIEDYTIIHEH